VGEAVAAAAGVVAAVCAKAGANELERAIEANKLNNLFNLLISSS
jgi:predicted nicotinamide N-methyase